MKHLCERKWFHRSLPDWCCSICAGFLPVENGGWPAPPPDAPNGPKCWCLRHPLMVLENDAPLRRVTWIERVRQTLSSDFYFSRSEQVRPSALRRQSLENTKGHLR